ncbi:MAG: TIGR00730 family Rossman fold protein, partial [Planktomarina sp.]
MTKSICVFCGARAGSNPAFAASAQQLGQALADMNWRLVYGAGDVGLMGQVANSAQSAGAKSFGVIPQHLLDWEVGKRDLDQFIVTDDMHTRKKLMFINSDGVVLLPGGAGSLDEFFEVLTWAQLRLHTKPIIVANIEGYWQPMLDLVDHVIAQGFADPSLKSLFQV